MKAVYFYAVAASPKALRSQNENQCKTSSFLYRCYSHVVNNNVKHLFSPDFNKWYHVVPKKSVTKTFSNFPIGNFAWLLFELFYHNYHFDSFRKNIYIHICVLYSLDWLVFNAHGYYYCFNHWLWRNERFFVGSQFLRREESFLPLFV